MIKLKQLLTELIKVDLTTSKLESYNILLYKKYLYIMDESSDLSKIINIFDNHPDKKAVIYLKRASDIVEFLQSVTDSFPEAVVGTWTPENGTLYINYISELNPPTSLNVKKIADSLKIKRIEYIKGFEDNTFNLNPSRIKTGLPTKGYHGTSALDLGEILRNGLNPEMGESKFKKQNVIHYDHIFFTTEFEIAKFYSTNAVLNSYDKNENFPIILELRIPDPSLISPDFDADINPKNQYYHNRTDTPQHLSDMKAMGLSRETGKWGYKGKILPMFIRWIWYYDKNNQKWKKSSQKIWKKLLDNYDLYTIGYKLGALD